MKRIGILAAAAVMALTSLPVSAIKVHTIGDSTMANYDEDSTVTRGWGMYLQLFLDGVEVNNRGRGGSDTRGFFEDEARWASVKQQMEAGDYVLIQFAHNDEKHGGMDAVALRGYYLSIGDSAKAASVDNRGTTPSGTYREYLQRFVAETRALGCRPVLVAPACRCYFKDSTIRRNGRHDLGDKFSKITADGPTEDNKVAADDHTMDYVWQMRLVAEETGTPFIDLTTATAELYESYGNETCRKLLFDGTGATHFNTAGATLVARLCARLMQAQGILADHIRIPADGVSDPAGGMP